MNNLRISPPPLSSCKNLPAYFFNGAYGVDAPPAVYCVVNNNKTKKNSMQSMAPSMCPDHCGTRWGSWFQGILYHISAYLVFMRFAYFFKMPRKTDVPGNILQLTATMSLRYDAIVVGDAVRDVT